MGTSNCGLKREYKPMNTLDTEAFRQRLVDGDNKAWNQLAAAIKSKFHCSDFEGHGEEDFVQEALIKFSACLAAGKIEPNVPIIPYILVIARNKQISAVRKESRRAKLVSNSPQEVGERIGQTDKTEHQSPKVSIDALSAQEQLAIAINGFRTVMAPKFKTLTGFYDQRDFQAKQA